MPSLTINDLFYDSILVSLLVCASSNASASLESFKASVCNSWRQRVLIICFFFLQQFLSPSLFVFTVATLFLLYFSLALQLVLFPLYLKLYNLIAQFPNLKFLSSFFLWKLIALSHNLIDISSFSFKRLTWQNGYLHLWKKIWRPYDKWFFPPFLTLLKLLTT